MPTSRRIAAVLLASAFTALPVFAQGRGPTQQMPTQVPQPSQVSPFIPQSDLPIVNFAFDGGTLRAFVDAIKKQCPSVEINVGFRGEAERVQMPAISMKGVSIGTAMQSMNTLADPGSGRYVNVLPLQERNGAPLYSVEIRNMTDYMGNTLGNATTTKVFSLRELVRASGSDQNSPQQTAELVLSVLEATMEVEASESRTPPTLRYHKDSGMLIARGTSNQLQVIESVLATMQRDAQNNPGYPGVSLLQEIAKAEAEVSLSRATLEHRRQESDAAKEQLERITKMRDSGAASDAELGAAREGVLKSNYDVEKAHIQLNLAEQMLDAIKKTGKPPVKQLPLNAKPDRANPSPQTPPPAPGK